MNLIEYVRNFTERGECQCGKCIDKGPDRVLSHAVSVGLFDVCLAEYHGKNPDLATFKTTLAEHHGVFNEVDLFDGKEHGYIELGGWIGDQGDALRMMGLGALLGAWRLLTPQSVMGNLIPAEMQMALAQRGMITIQSEPKP